MHLFCCFLLTSYEDKSCSFLADTLHVSLVSAMAIFSIKIFIFPAIAVYVQWKGEVQNLQVEKNLLKLQFECFPSGFRQF